jgi:hypothetical protein
MNTLEPRNFKHLPLFYRPKQSVKVSKGFAKKVRGISHLGGRADDENIANVSMTMDEMRQLTPSVFLQRQPRAGGEVLGLRKKTQKKRTALDGKKKKGMWLSKRVYKWTRKY